MLVKRLALILLGALLAGTATASVGIKAVTIIKGGDGNLYSRFPDGNVDPPPPYEALSFNIGAALATAGIGAMQCGTAGTDFSHDVRQYLTGTNSATADISVVFVSGSTWATSGGNDPDTGDNLTFECADPDVSSSGVMQVSATDGTSTDASTNKTWASVAQEAPPPVTDRDVIVDWGFESGAIIDRNTLTNGVSKDAIRIQYLKKRATFTISAITNATSAEMFWSGADPSFTNPSGSNTTTGEAGFTIGTVTGMTQMSNRLVRCLPASINTTANKCTLKQDGNDDQSSDGNDSRSDHNVNTIGYGLFSGTATAQLWQSGATSGSSSLGPATTENLRVVTSATPPDNLNGSALAFSPREGNYFFSALIGKNEDYSAIGGQGTTDTDQPGKNKPRMSFLPIDDGTVDVANSLEACFGMSIAVPSNYDHNDRGGQDPTENHLVRMAESNAQDEAAFSLSLAGDASGADHWVLTLDYGTHNSGNSATDAHDIDLGVVTGDIGKWNDWLFKFKLVNSTAGYMKVYHRTANRDGSSGVSAWSQVYSRVNLPVGHTYANKFRPAFRYYKHGWTDNEDTTPSLEIWHGWDSGYFTRFTQDGGTCADVTVDGSDPTL